MLGITRTANAGVLLELDGTRILLDGVCGEVKPYLPTPDRVKEKLTRNFPDLMAVTHRHTDHCDPAYESAYEKATGRQVICPECAVTSAACGSVRLTAVPSRHIGKADCDHFSYVIQGSRCLWFMGDASPSQWKNRPDLPKPDVVICPYAYAATESAWRITCQLGAQAVVLLHLPDRAQDAIGLWSAVEQTVGDNGGVLIPKMEEFIKIDF